MSTASPAELARAVGVHRSTMIRFLDRSGIPCEQDPATGWRRYDRDAALAAWHAADHPSPRARG